MAVGPEAQNTDPTGYCAASEVTVTVNVQLCPPTLIAKLAVPAVAGVPVMVYTNAPEPVFTEPAGKEAVSPITPVELTLCAA